VLQTPSGVGTLEGARFYKRNGYYYIWLTRPANGQYVLRSTSPWGPYEIRQVLLDMPGPITGAGLAMLRDQSAWIGVKRDNGAYRVVMTNGLTMNSSWQTTGAGTEQAGREHLRRPDLAAGQRRHPPGFGPAGPLLLQHRRDELRWPWPGLHVEQRLAVLHGLPIRIFNYTTQSLGGAVTVRRFDLTTP
jgi:hypothetical protein